MVEALELMLGRGLAMLIATAIGWLVIQSLGK